VPTLFVHGTHDPFGTPLELEVIRGLILARTAVIPVDGGHDLGWSRGRTDAALPGRIVTAFLEMLGGTSG
jgi:predicted alpha/beta-hydrolase family hydrolase